MHKTSERTDIDKEVHNLMKKNANKPKSTYAIIEDLKQKFPEECKELYNQYRIQCTNFKITTDPKADLLHQGKMEILEKLLQMLQTK